MKQILKSGSKQARTYSAAAVGGGKGREAKCACFDCSRDIAHFAADQTFAPKQLIPSRIQTTGLRLTSTFLLCFFCSTVLLSSSSLVYSPYKQFPGRNMSKRFFPTQIGLHLLEAGRSQSSSGGAALRGKSESRPSSVFVSEAFKQQILGVPLQDKSIASSFKLQYLNY